MRKTLTALLGTVLISSALIGCGNHEKKPSAPQITQQPKQAQELPEVYWVEGDDGYSTETQSNEFTGIKSRGNLANLSKLEEGKNYGHNIETGEIVEISGQKYRITNLSRSENPFNQEPEKPGEPEYVTKQEMRQQMDQEYIPKIIEKIRETVRDEMNNYFKPKPTYEHHQPKPSCNQQSGELPMIPIQPPFNRR